MFATIAVPFDDLRSLQAGSNGWKIHYDTGVEMTIKT